MRCGPPRLTVYIDGLCSCCRRAGQLLKAFDLVGAVEVRSFRHERSFVGFGLTEQALERELQVVVAGASGHRVYGGFAGVKALLRHMPALWPLWPVAWLVDVTGFGTRAYRWLADRRPMVPHPQACARTSRERGDR